MTTSPSSLTLPIAEVFTSVHGEGYWVGTPMTFIRTAGCTVGKSFRNNGPAPVDFPMFPDKTYMFQCTTFDGRTFPCDTDYRKKDVLRLDELVCQIPPHIKHVCITGGEPLMHQNRMIEMGLFPYLAHQGIVVHWETSGSIMPEWPKEMFDHYWACSPKAGVLGKFLTEYADEVRLMVDPHFNKQVAWAILSQLRSHTEVFFAPLSREDDVLGFSPENIEKCLELLKWYPSARISIQQHKILGVR